jgi:transposase
LASEFAPPVLAQALMPVLDEIDALEARLKQLDRTLAELAKQHADARHLLTVPGVGVTIATAMIGSVGDIHAFTRARQFAAWLGITPREYNSGQTRYLGRISKRGDRYLRMLLIHGARAALLRAHPLGGLDARRLLGALIVESPNGIETTHLP